MNLNHFYHYYKSKSGGLSNLLLGSEELDQSDQGEWVRYNMNAVNANVPGVANPLSSDETVEQLDFQASTVARIAQTVTLTAGTEYTFSVWARAASGTKPFRLRYWDNVGGSGGGSAFTASATWSASTGRYEMTFTAQNSGTFQMFIQNAGGTAASRRIYFWGAMLNVGATALDYVKTEFPIGLSNPPTPPMEFGDNFAGVTAYYSLRRFTKGEDNNAIRVRRSSDDTEQDIGFDANGDLDTTALLAFVNADVNQYTSDFSSTENLSEFNGAGAAAQSIGGVDDAYKFTLSGGNVQHTAFTSANTLESGKSFTIVFDYYIPSGQTLSSIVFDNFGGSGAISGSLNVTDNWTTATINFTADGTRPRWWAGAFGANVNGDGDVFYLKNIVVTQTTADGAVTTFYDQSGNGNNATNATESEQPLVVSGGTLVTENSKAAIEFSGNPVYLDASSAIADAFTGNSVYYKFEVAQVTSTSKGGILCANTGYRSFFNPPSYDYANFHNPNGLEVISSLNVDRTNQFLFSESFNANTGGGTYELYGNGSLERSQGSEGTSNLDTPTSVYIGRDPSGGTSGYLVGKIQEIIFFDSDQSSNRTGIETNINDHFDIYS